MLIDLPTTSESLVPIGTPLPSGHSRHLIADGIKGTAQTIEMMQKLVASAKRDNNVRKVVGQAIQKCKAKDYFGYAKALYEWVRDNIKYAYDPHNVEFLEAPSRVLENKIGDCDSQDMLLCAMFEQVGLQSQFVTIKADASRPNEYTHVYTRVLIPKVGWICADPIMPEKWFGWEPPYPEKRFWPASSDDANTNMDTTPSIPFPSPGNPAQMSFDPVNGMSGMSGMGRGGHHGWRGRRGAGGGGWYGGPIWGGGFDDNIYVLPVAVPMPDQIVVVEGQDIEPQELENPLSEENATMGAFGLNGIIDDIANSVESAFGKAASVIGVGPAEVSQSVARALLGKIGDGTEAKRLTDARTKLNDRVDRASKALFTARALPDTNPSKSKVIEAATSLRNSLYQEQSALNEQMFAYNELAAVVNNLPGVTANSIPALRGLGWVHIAAGVAVGATVLWIVKRYYDADEKRSAAASEATRKESVLIEAMKDPAFRSDYLKLQSQTQNRNTTVSGECGWNPTTWSDCFNKGSGEVVRSAMTLGLIGLAFYGVYRVIGYGANVADSKIKKTLELT